VSYIIVTLTVSREGDQFVSSCVELGTSTCGSSEREAVKNIVEATELYLNTLEDLNECSQVLTEKGVKLHSRPGAGSKLQCPASAIVYPAVFPVQTACA